MKDLKAQLIAATDVDALNSESNDGFSFFRQIWQLIEPVISSLNVEALDQSQRQAAFDQIKGFYFWAAERVDIPYVPEFAEKIAERRIWRNFLEPTLADLLKVEA